MKTILSQLNEISNKLDELELVKFADMIDEIMQKIAISPEQELIDINNQIDKTTKDEQYYQDESENTQNIKLPKIQETVEETKQRLEALRAKQKILKNPPPEPEPTLEQPILTPPTGLGGNQAIF